MKDMSTALFRLDLSNRCVNYRKSNNNKVRVDAGKKREKTFVILKKIYYSFSLVYYKPWEATAFAEYS